MKNQQNQLLTSLFGVNKTARIGAISATVTLRLLAVLIALNALLGLLPSSIAKPDVTGTETFKLSATARDWLQGLNEDVTLYLVCEDGAANADGDLYHFLERYGEENSRIRVKVLDPSADGDTVEALGVKSDELTDMSIVVESAYRVRVIDNSELYYYVYNDGSNTMTLSPEDYSSMYSYFMELDSTGETLAGFMSYIAPYFDGDARVTNAINYVTQDKVAVAYVLTGSGASALDVQFTRLLHQSCYETRTLLDLTAVPEDCDVLVINSPTVDLTEAETGVLSAYLANGGKLFLTTYYSVGALPNLGNVLSAYGMSFETSVKKVYDGNPNYYFEGYSGAVQNMFRTQINSEHAITGKFDESFVIFDAHAIKVTET